ncbi:inositol-1,4,5-trisphosphate 5-phosphatase [Schistosoma bovis]|uniref:Inositol-1,4,5-trisphosphate 5-phosphatase n=1 Tax=Schistosoma bovis TaxID=6184 RepID=A0A430QLB9_SCHBO|nr:inositol-1,4,5-trisphosphate 5-phosphatase [Schistosoma bovis]
MIFLSCHFTAHRENKQDRLNDYIDIIDHQSFRDEDVNVIIDHDYVFWMGDLNFRIDHLKKSEVELMVKQKRFNELLQHDQLLNMKNEKLLFHDFNEGTISFPPTFKFDKGTDTYDSRTSLDSYLLNILAYSFNANLEISYQVLDPPGLLRLSETNSLLSSKQYVPVSDFAKLLLLNTLGHSSKSGKSESTNDDDLGPLAPPTLQTTSFDWIALYPAEFADLEKDYITYVYASSNVSQAKHRKNSVSSALLQPSNTAKFQELYKARIESSRLKDLPGQSFCLVYMSRNKHCPQGYSLPFKVSFWRISQ